MPQETKISWTNFSANPLKYRNADGKDVWACAKVSDGCKNCYSESIALRFNRGKAFTAANMKQVTPYLDVKECRALLTSKKISGKRVFLADMTDCFGDWVPDEMLDRLIVVIALRPDVTFQVLTKRAERLPVYFNRLSESLAPLMAAASEMGYLFNFHGSSVSLYPLPNLWFGVSVEDQRNADERIPHLLATPAVVRFLSVEPMLGPVDLWGARYANPNGGQTGAVTHWPGGANWVIIGCESNGPRPGRECKLEWVESIVGECREAGVACHVKQIAVDGKLLHRHTGEPWPDAWPKSLRVQEFPNGS